MIILRSTSASLPPCCARVTPYHICNPQVATPTALPPVASPAPWPAVGSHLQPRPIIFKEKPPVAACGLQPGRSRNWSWSWSRSQGAEGAHASIRRFLATFSLSRRMTITLIRTTTATSSARAKRPAKTTSTLPSTTSGYRQRRLRQPVELRARTERGRAEQRGERVV